MEGNKRKIAEGLTLIIMGEDYREPDKRTLKTLWRRIKKCLFGL
jgi:hypothetical protein